VSPSCPDASYPDVEVFRRQAKRLLRQAKGGDPQAALLLPRTDRPFRLADAQFAVARAVGFQSWPALVRAMDSWTRVARQTEVRTRLVLVRGGEGDAAGRFSEHGGPRLNDIGRTQAEQAAIRLAGIVKPELVEPVLSSHRVRNIETARTIASALGVPFGGPTCDLCQMHPGAAEGLTQREMTERFGLSYSFVPGAESWRDYVGRGPHALHGLAGQHQGRTVIAVTDSAVLKASFIAFGGMSAPAAAEVMTSQGSITEWSCLVQGDPRRVGAWRLDRFNEVPGEPAFARPSSP
jgi:broad specificity phosphatase PhoE